MAKIKLCITKIVIGISLGYVFYRSFLMMLIFSILLLSIPSKEKKSLEGLILLEFKEFLNGIHSELLVGQSFRNAVDLTIILHQVQSESLKESLLFLNKSLKLGVSDVTAWQHFSSTMDNKYITEFVDVLEVTYAYSGNIVEIIKNTIHTISDAIDLTLELQVMIAAKRLEFYMMMLLPILLLGLLSYSQYEYMSVLYQSILGRIVMTSVLIGMTVSFFIGKEIIKVEPI